MGETVESSVNPKTKNEEVGERIKKLRLNKGWTQEDLAELLGYDSKSTILKMEKGKQRIDAEILDKFCKLFEVSIEYLFTNTECKNVSIKDYPNIEERIEEEALHRNLQIAFAMIPQLKCALNPANQKRFDSELINFLKKS